MRFTRLCVLGLAMVLGGCSAPHGQPEPLAHTVSCDEKVYSLRSGECLEYDAFVDRLEPYPVIFVGDHHLSTKQHRFVADVIERLGKRGYRVHLTNEWFGPEDNDVLAAYAAKTLDDSAFTEKIGWDDRVSFTFATFSPVYHAVRDSGGVLYGVNLSKEERKRISDVNVTGMDADERTFFESLDLNVSAHRQLLSPFFGTCHRPKNGESDEECTTRMYRVQVAWDAKMGRESARLAEHVLESRNDKLIVFVGAMHLSYGLGVNLRFARESSLPFVTVLPQSWERGRVEHGQADFVYLYEEEKEAKEAEEEIIRKLEEKNRDSTSGA